MSTAQTLAARDRSNRLVPVLDRTAIGAVLLIPLLLLHAHGIAEGAVAVTDACFLARSTLARDWAWLRTPWLLIGLAWWGWVVLCSIPVPALGLGAGGTDSLVQAIVTLRFLVLVAAMEHSVLRSSTGRRWLYWIILAATTYIALQSAIQFLFGRNLYGVRSAWGDVLTGPFRKPRAGPPLSRILLPALIPIAARLLAARKPTRTIAAMVLLLLAVCIMVLIGQRMPLLLIAASPVIAPGAYYRQVRQFSQQMEGFGSSPYGELYARALEIGIQHPLIGAGGDGFRYSCQLPRYFAPSLDGKLADDGGAAICAGHPHNFYAEALVDGGFVGLALFCGLAVAWLLPLARGLWRDPDPLRVGLFAAAVIQLWPFASTSAFVSMPMGGWFFFLLGWGMAEARWPRPAP
jgi:O-Antigen ligase